MSRNEEKIKLLASLPFFALHLACLLAFWVGASWIAIGVCLGLYWLRMLGITAGYHRYFSHGSFKTSRAFQFVLAWIGCMSVQKGPLWWASMHRHHHAHSDEEEDVHSPVTKSFWWSHVGWILSAKYDQTKWHLISNLTRYRELRWLNKYHVVPGASLGVSLYIGGWLLERYAPSLRTNGWQMFIWGFVISTVLLYHGTFVINSLAHVFGKQRYSTKDESRNNLWLALITLGEGWHNNHHFAPSSARLGFRWYEIDIAHYVLVALSWIGVVWDLQQPPQRAYDPDAAESRAA